MKREKNPFSIFFDQKLNALNEREGWDLTKRDIGVALGIGDEMFRKIVNKNKPNQDRDCINDYDKLYYAYHNALNMYIVKKIRITILGVFDEYN